MTCCLSCEFEIISFVPSAVLTPPYCRQEATVSSNPLPGITRTSVFCKTSWRSCWARPCWNGSIASSAAAVAAATKKQTLRTSSSCSSRAQPNLRAASHQSTAVKDGQMQARAVNATAATSSSPLQQHSPLERLHHLQGSRQHRLRPCHFPLSRRNPQQESPRQPPPSSH